MTTPEIVERWAGWGVLIVVLIWFMKRSDTRDKLMQDAFTKLSEAVNALAGIEKQNSEDHKSIVETLDRVDRNTRSD